MRPDTTTILMVDDDADDRLLAREALQESEVAGTLRFVGDGDELLRYLRRQGEFRGADASPYPRLILLDLNMPRKDGRETLVELKADPALRRIPVVVMTTSRSPEDVRGTYELGAASYIPKPASFDGLVDVMRSIGRYWLDTVQVAGADA